MHKQKNSSNKVLPQWVSIEPLDLWFQVQHSPFWTNLAFAWKTETLGFSFSYTLLIPTKSVNICIIANFVWFLKNTRIAHQTLFFQPEMKQNFHFSRSLYDVKLNWWNFKSTKPDLFTVLEKVLRWVNVKFVMNNI